MLSIAERSVVAFSTADAPAGQSPWLVEVPCSVKAERCGVHRRSGKRGSWEGQRRSPPTPPQSLHRRAQDARPWVRRRPSRFLRQRFTACGVATRVPARRLMRDRAKMMRFGYVRRHRTSCSLSEPASHMMRRVSVSERSVAIESLNLFRKQLRGLVPSRLASPSLEAVKL
jgi:hypothetical protein